MAYVIGTDLCFGFPGTISSHADEISTSRALKSNSAPVPFGSPVALNNDGTVSKFGAGHTATDFAGFAKRKIKQARSFQEEQFGQYHPNEMVDILERGSISVICPTGTPTAGGAVYIRVLANATDYPNAQVGDIEAVSDTVTDNGTTTYNNIVIPNCKFKCGKDSNNVTEITIIERQGV